MTLTISRILHAGYLFRDEATCVVFDPVFENPFSGNCHAFPDVRFDLPAIGALRPDAVFISHFHDDHCSLESLHWLKRDIPIYLYCLFDELFDMIRALGFEQVHPLAIDMPVRIGTLEIIPRRALEANIDAMFHVRSEGLNILNVVDATLDPATLRQLGRYAPWDVVMWPFQIMREAEVIAPSQAEPAPSALPTEWIQQLQRLNPRLIVPSACQFRHESWSWYNQAFFPISYAMFERDIMTALPHSTVMRLNPGQGMCIDKQTFSPSVPLAFVIPVGDQDVDYAFDARVQPPATADMARHFPGLTTSEAERIHRYCAVDIIDQYARLEPLDEGYFTSPRHWRLSLYDHLGQVQHFHYQVHAAFMTPCDAAAPLDWTTEVIAQKLDAALYHGETLTSMYLRINEGVVDHTHRATLMQTEIADDPLIRCLFDEGFARYQREQLRRLGVGS